MSNFEGRRHFGFRRPTERRIKPYVAPPMRLKFRGGERVTIDLGRLEPADVRKIEGRDLAGAIVVAMTGGSSVMVRLTDQSTHWLPERAVHAATAGTTGGTSTARTSAETLTDSVDGQ